MNIGDKIKQLRIIANLTQEELANRCELSKGFISQLERDLTSPSIATLVDILECLGTDLKAFFNDTGNDKIVFHKDDVFMQEDENLLINWIVPNAQKNVMEPILMELKAGGKSSVYNAHAGEVFGYIIQGAVVVHIGDKQFKAKKGESIYYKANAAYYIENPTRNNTIALLVSSPPNF